MLSAIRLFSRNNANKNVPSFIRRSMTKEAYSNPAGGNFSMTKVVGTIGPISENYETLQACVNEGLRIMRINFSHATYEEADLRIKNLQSCRGVHSTQRSPVTNNLRSVLLDTQGPEIRCGTLVDDVKITLKKGNEILLTTDEAFKMCSTADTLYITYQKLSTTVKVGDIILLDDGLIELTVLEIEGVDKVRCIIKNTEQLGSRKGVNLPGLSVDLPALTDKDKKDIEYGVKNDVDFVAASFVRTAKDVQEIRDFINTCHATHWPEGYPAPAIISKIENQEGITNFKEILALSDGIMVARGDLGVEIPFQKVLTYQKYMVDECNAIGKPVIVATQMLESMIKNPRPTRAEVCDVGNAVLDGADCVMLSGEVAYGQFPVESVKTMIDIVKEADALLKKKHPQYLEKVCLPNTDVDAIASSVVNTAQDTNAKLIIVLTDTGSTARLVAKYRPNVPVMCYAACQKVSRQLQIHRGLYPIVSPILNERPTPRQAIENAKSLGWLTSGDKVVVLNAEELSETLGTQIMMRIATVQ